MATDYRGNLLTPEQVEGLERFDRNDVPMKLCRTPSTTLTFEIDETYQNEHEEDADVYSLLLPSQMHDFLFIPTVGEMITFSQQYAGEVLDKSIIKQFQVTQVEKAIEQSVACFCLFLTVSVVPVEEQEQKHTERPMMYCFVYEQQYNDMPGWGPNNQLVEAYDIGEAFASFGHVVKAMGLTVRNIRYGAYSEMEEEMQAISDYWENYHRQKKSGVQSTTWKVDVFQVDRVHPITCYEGDDFQQVCRRIGDMVMADAIDRVEVYKNGEQYRRADIF